MKRQQKVAVICKQIGYPEILSQPSHVIMINHYLYYS